MAKTVQQISTTRNQMCNSCALDCNKKGQSELTCLECKLSHIKGLQLDISQSVAVLDQHSLQYVHPNRVWFYRSGKRSLKAVCKLAISSSRWAAVGDTKREWLKSTKKTCTWSSSCVMTTFLGCRSFTTTSQSCICWRAALATVNSAASPAQQALWVYMVWQS